MKWGVASVFGLLIFLLFFHIVPASVSVFPKQYPSFAETFINVDDYLAKYNEANFISKIAMRQSYLFQKLQENKIIVDRERGSK